MVFHFSHFFLKQELKEEDVMKKGCRVVVLSCFRTTGHLKIFRTMDSLKCTALNLL
jgi:hypothetical protein